MVLWNITSLKLFWLFTICIFSLWSRSRRDFLPRKRGCLDGTSLNYSKKRQLAYICSCVIQLLYHGPQINRKALTLFSNNVASNGSTGASLAVGKRELEDDLGGMAPSEALAFDWPLCFLDITLKQTEWYMIPVFNCVQAGFCESNWPTNLEPWKMLNFFIFLFWQTFFW